ncbi:MAG: alpha/beta fold hydrolase [Deltaproteobacteria bacterium]
MTRDGHFALTTLLALGALAVGCKSASTHAVEVDTTPTFVGVAPNPAEMRDGARDGVMEMIAGEHAAYVVVGDPSDIPGVYRSPLEEQLTVVILHGRSGLTDYERRFADSLAELGFAAIVPDLGVAHHPVGAPTTPEEFEAITAALHHATEKLPVRARQVVVVGFADGAAHALRVAAMEDHVSAVVAYTPPSNVPAPLDVELLAFDGAAGFERPDASTYDRSASAKAWSAVKSFLSKIYDPYLASS